MYRLDVTYPTKLGNLNASMTTGVTLDTRAEAEELRATLATWPRLASARFAISREPRPTVDEALKMIRRSLDEMPPREADDQN